MGEQRSRDQLNARLRELGRTTPFSEPDWVAAAMYLGDGAETLLPAVEALVAAGYSPIGAARSMELLCNPEPPYRSNGEA